MSAISAKEVKALRDRTGAGVLACREALSEAQGDVERAVEILRAELVRTMRQCGTTSVAQITRTSVATVRL